MTLYKKYIYFTMYLFVICILTNASFSSTTIYGFEAGGYPSGMSICDSDTYSINPWASTNPDYVGERKLVVYGDNVENPMLSFEIPVTSGNTYTVEFAIRKSSSTVPLTYFKAGAFSYANGEGCSDWADHFSNDLTDYSSEIDTDYNVISMQVTATSDYLVLLTSMIISSNATTYMLFIDEIAITDLGVITATPTQSFALTATTTPTLLPCGETVVYDFEESGIPPGMLRCDSAPIGINYDNSTAVIWNGSEQLAYNSDDGEEAKFAFTFKAQPGRSYTVSIHLRATLLPPYSLTMGMISFADGESCSDFTFSGLTDYTDLLDNGWLKFSITHTATDNNIALLLDSVLSITATNYNLFVDDISIIDNGVDTCTPTPTVTYQTCTPQATSVSCSSFQYNDFEEVGFPSNIIDCTDEGDADIAVNFDNSDDPYSGSYTLAFNTQESDGVKYGFYYSSVAGNTYSVSFYAQVPSKYDYRDIAIFNAGVKNYNCDTCDVPPFDSWENLTDYRSSLSASWTKITLSDIVATGPRIAFMFYFVGTREPNDEIGMFIDYIEVIDLNCPTMTPTYPTSTPTSTYDTYTPTPTNTLSFTATYSSTPSFTETFTVTSTPTPSFTFTATATPTPTLTPTLTFTSTQTIQDCLKFYASLTNSFTCNTWVGGHITSNLFSTTEYGSVKAPTEGESLSLYILFYIKNEHPNRTAADVKVYCSEYGSSIESVRMVEADIRALKTKQCKEPVISKTFISQSGSIANAVNVGDILPGGYAPVWIELNINDNIESSSEQIKFKFDFGCK